MRKLASIRTVAEVQPIPGADQIEKIRVDGWWCVSRKGTFKIEDPCVYYEVDSLLPEKEQYSFMANGTSIKKSITDEGQEVQGYRLKTVVLRGQVSQGLALPLNLFPELSAAKVGNDVTDLLGIHKYDPPIPVHLSGEVRGNLPGFLPKTDEERIQNSLELLELHKGKRFYLTSKIDGSSGTIYNYEGDFGVCGRALNFKEDDKNSFWRIAHKYDLKNKLPKGIAIQGELAGEKVQDNRLRLKGIDLYVFYAIDIAKYEYLLLDETRELVKSLGMKMVPIIDENFILNHSYEDLIKMADMPSPLNPNFPQEGIVFRLYDERRKISFKSISNEYLLRWGL